MFIVELERDRDRDKGSRDREDPTPSSSRPKRERERSSRSREEGEMFGEFGNGDDKMEVDGEFDEWELRRLTSDEAIETDW